MCYNIIGNIINGECYGGSFMKKTNEKSTEIVCEKEADFHGSEDFPLGMHKTIVPASPQATPEAKKFILYAHWHNEFEFFYLSRGECNLCINGNEYHLKSGDAAFIPPSATHWAYSSDTGSETVFYAVVFDSKMLSWYGNDVIKHKYISPIVNHELTIGPLFSRSVPWQENVMDKFISIMSLYDYTQYNNDPDNVRHPQLFLKKDVSCPELQIKSILFDIWQICFEHAVCTENERRVSKTNYDRIHNAIEYIHEHYNEKISLSDIAQSVYMSKEYFSHIFKECMKCQPFVYLNTYRINKSIEYLDETDLKIIEIASCCGFDHVGYYNRKFMEIMKCTPTEYRKKRYELQQNAPS